METKTHTEPPKAEVGVRTLASDLVSIETGHTTPVTKIITPDLSKNFGSEGEGDGAAHQKKSNPGRQIVMIIVLLAILAVGYFFVYPRLKEVLSDWL